MIYYNRIKKQEKRCHSKTMMHSETDKGQKNGTELGSHLDEWKNTPKKSSDF
jgi:hypothetical protein